MIKLAKRNSKFSYKKAAMHSKSEVEKNFTKDVALVVWLAEKGLSFRCIESDAFVLYHEAFGWTPPPNRRRTCGNLFMSTKRRRSRMSFRSRQTQQL